MRDTGLSRYDDDDGAYDTKDTIGKSPFAGLRVAADMEMIEQEYHGKKVSRKKLEASSGAFGKYCCSIGNPRSTVYHDVGKCKERLLM